VIVRAQIEGIALERKRVLQAGKLLIAESGCFAQWAGSADPASGGVFVGKSALESHYDMAAVLHIIRNPLQQGVVRDVKHRDNEQLIL